MGMNLVCVEIGFVRHLDAGSENAWFQEPLVEVLRSRVYRRELHDHNVGISSHKWEICFILLICKNCRFFIRVVLYFSWRFAKIWSLWRDQGEHVVCIYLQFKFVQGSIGRMSDFCPAVSAN